MQSDETSLDYSDDGSLLAPFFLRFRISGTRHNIEKVIGRETRTDEERIGQRRNASCEDVKMGFVQWRLKKRYQCFDL